MTEPDGTARRHARAMILAAGYGTRLAPVTDQVAKPLLPVDGEPLLDRIITQLLRAGVTAIAVNSHHLGWQLTEHLGRHPRREQLVQFPEAEILGTGGALDKARDFLAVAPCFVVYNGDVLCDVDLTGLLAEHARTGARATLLLVDWPAVNSVTLAADGAVTHIGGTGRAQAAVDGDRRLTYAGVGVFERTLLDDIGPGFSSLIAPLVSAIATERGSVRGYAPAGVAWNDLGTLHRWLGAVGRDVRTDTGFSVQRITGHGSDRRFWRLAQGDWSAVAMISPPDDAEFVRLVAVGRFLAAQDLGPARLLSVDEAEKTILMEDLGQTSLYDLAASAQTPPAELRAHYLRVVDHLLELQAASPAAGDECPLAVDRSLDLEQLRWETSYFQEHFLQGHLALAGDQLTALAPEFANLAAAVAGQPQVLIHRDFQSQNILLQGGQVRLVDYQGVRLGPVAYDLASLVWDPYVDLSDGLRQELVARFAGGSRVAAADAIGAMTVAAGLQRVMQALGAFAFLGHVKEKTEFLAHIPAGVHNLLRLLAGLGPSPAGPDRTAAAHLPPPMPNLTRLLALTPRNESGP